MKTKNPIILLYHSIEDRGDRDDFWSLSVSPENFLAQLEALVCERDVVSLDELGTQMHRGRIPEGTVVVTFDDGYANNIKTARPILEQIGITGTLFVATGMIGEREFWWDRLERILNTATSPLEKLTFWVQSEPVNLDFRNYKRDQLLVTVWAKLRDIAHSNREAVLDELEEVLAAPPPTQVNRPLTEEEVSDLSDGPITVGAHSVNHPSLPNLPCSRIESEIAYSKKACEEWLGRPCTSFSYPFGACDALSRDCVVAQGFNTACAANPSLVTLACDAFALPRVAVGDWAAAEFMERLETI